MSRILGISGAKQSGKSTSMKFLHGYQLRFYDVIEKFLMDENGDIFVNAKMINESGEEEDTVAILDVERRDPEFLEWASTSIWPFIKCYSFSKLFRSFSFHKMPISVIVIWTYNTS